MCFVVVIIECRVFTEGERGDQRGFCCREEEEEGYSLEWFFPSYDEIRVHINMALCKGIAKGVRFSIPAYGRPHIA